MSASWTHYLCDAAGASIADLSTATGRSIAFRRNMYVESQLTISHEDAAGALLLDSLNNAGVPRLKAYRRNATSAASTLQMHGELVALQEVAEDTSLITATFRSPFGVLLGGGGERGRFLTTTQTYTDTDAGLIAKGLVDLANADGVTGLTTSAGLIAATKIRSRTYPAGTNIGEAVVNLTNVLDGFDFYEQWVDDPTQPSTMAQLVVVPSQGSDNPGARFEYGPTTLANVRSLQRDTQLPENTIFVIGANGLTSTYSDAASVAQYGKRYGKYEFPDVSDQGTLDDKARGLMRSRPVKTLRFAYDPALGPAPFDDFNLGDTVRFFARRGALNENASVRVNAFSVMIDDNGNEAAEIQDPTTPGEDAVLRAGLAVEVVT